MKSRAACGEKSLPVRIVACLQSGGVGLGARRFSPLSVLLGTAFLAYSFGLRHAVDAITSRPSTTSPAS